jgi:selenide,water dikinase
LAHVLRHVPQVADPNVLVDASTRDDAAVYRLSPDRVLVATTDFFTPIVDDAATWGAIAAANALSDLYAMGATPLFGLNLVGWPRETLPLDLLGEVLRGAADVCARARCPILGGHSIDDPEPKFGMVVIGEAHPDRMLLNSAARPGDLLVLTKPLGTGVLATALKRDVIEEADLAPAVASMTTLNAGAMRAALASGVRAATDVTGFGLLGHLGQMLLASGVAAELQLEAIPLLDRARELAAAGCVPGGTTRNLAASSAEWQADITQADRLLLADAQTSGGLLLVVPPTARHALLAALAAEQTPAAAVIGRCLDGQPGAIRVHRVP